MPAGPMYDATQLVMEQTFAKSHAMHMSNADRENAGFANIAEQTRLLFLTRSQGNDLAQDILDQRAAGGQPQASAGNAGVNSGSVAK